MIVVDTNLVAALLCPVPERALAEAVFSRDPHWAAPRLWRSELRNVLVRAVRHGRIDPGFAERACGQAHALLRGREHDVEDGVVLRLAAASACTAYDCEFVALAEFLAVPLVTFDRQVLASFPATAIHPGRFGSGAFWGDRVSEALESFSTVSVDGASASRPRAHARPRLTPRPAPRSPGSRRGTARARARRGVPAGTP